MDAGKPVGIWIRVSTEDQVRGESPEHHEKRARYYAESKGWEVREVYRLEAISGKSVMHLPETQRMLADIKSGHITGLIFSKLARLARNTKELLDFAEIFRQDNADLISLQESIDTSTPAGRLFYTMIAAMAQWEREEIADRVAASIPIRAKLGKNIGSRGTFGYHWVEGKLVPHPTEAPVRKLMYELFLEHRRKKTVVRILNERGYRSRNGKPFYDSTVEWLLRDPTAKGLRRANYSKSKSDKGDWAWKPKEEWIFVPVEPIVSAEIWDACNAILDQQHATQRKPARKAVHLFTGFAFCACGGTMRVPSNSPKYICQKCRNKVPTDDLEKIFHSQFKNYFLSADDIAAEIGKADQGIKAKEELLSAMRAEAERLQKEMDKIFRSFIVDELDGPTFARHHKPMEERLRQIENQIPELQGEVDFLKIQYLSSDRILSEAQDLSSRWPDLTREEKRKILENITERIIVGNDEITINLSYLPNSTKMVATGQQRLTGSGGM